MTAALIRRLSINCHLMDSLSLRVSKVISTCIYVNGRVPSPRGMSHASLLSLVVD